MNIVVNDLFHISDFKSLMCDVTPNRKSTNKLMKALQNMGENKVSYHVLKAFDDLFQ